MDEASNSRRSEPPEFVHPISIQGVELQEAVLAAELPPEHALAIRRVYRLLLAWIGGERRLDDCPEFQGFAEWEEDLLLGMERDEGVWAPLAVIVGELKVPAAAHPERLAHACLALSEWALDHGHSATGLLFAEVAALANWGIARRAYLVGRMLRERGRTSEAEEWLRRAMRVASASGDGEAYRMAQAEVQALSARDGG